MAVLLLAMIFFAINNTTGSESGYVNKNDYQAVWVNVGNTSQVYFGHIRAINSQYIALSDVFYLQSASSTPNKQLALTNLSCSAYNPQDNMVIKSTQVSYWNNLGAGSRYSLAMDNWTMAGSNCSNIALSIPSPTS
jgi:hypothetical protein